MSPDNPGALDPDVDFRDQFELDSVDYLNLVLELEKRLGIHVPEVDYPRLSCLAGCLGYLRAVHRHPGAPATTNSPGAGT